MKITAQDFDKATTAINSATATLTALNPLIGIGVSLTTQLVSWIQHRRDAGHEVSQQELNDEAARRVVTLGALDKANAALVATENQFREALRRAQEQK